MDSQSHPDRRCPKYGDQYPRRSAIFHDADTRMNLGMKMVRQMLDSRIKQFRRQDAAAC